MGYCKIECPDGETQCCIYCEKQGGCDNRCDMMDSYEYAEEHFKVVGNIFDQPELLQEK